MGRNGMRWDGSRDRGRRAAVRGGEGTRGVDWRVLVFKKRARGRGGERDRVRGDRRRETRDECVYD